MKKKTETKELTLEYLKSILDYDPETGVFRWKVYRARGARAGDIAGGLNEGYIRIKVNEKRYYAHRLAWFYYYGKWPRNQIDHINHIGNDNRIVNLRDVTFKENLKTIHRL